MVGEGLAVMWKYNTGYLKFEFNWILQSISSIDIGFPPKAKPTLKFTVQWYLTLIYLQINHTRPAVSIVYNLHF